jgi:zinc transport system permease protein
MMLFSSLFSALFSVGGLFLGWSFDAPAGAMVVIIAGVVYLGAALLTLILKRFKRG